MCCSSRTAPGTCGRCPLSRQPPDAHPSNPLGPTPAALSPVSSPNSRLPALLRAGRFPDGGKWGHCTSTDLVHWNCSHPSTNFGSGDTGGISVTPKGTFALWPVGARPLADGSSRWAEFPHRLMVCLQGIDMAVPTGPDLETWVKKGKVDNGGGQRDPGRAIKLKSGWYVPVSSAPKPGLSSGPDRRAPRPEAQASPLGRRA